MLTLAEIQSTMQIEYELGLEALDEQALRKLLHDPYAIRRMAPSHLSLDEARGIAEAVLADLVARKEPPDEEGVRSALQWPWAQWIGLLWAPVR